MLVSLPRDAGHDPAVASAPGHAQVDPARTSRRAGGAGRAPGSGDPAAGPGEPSLGLPAYPGRAQEAGVSVWRPPSGRCCVATGLGPHPDRRRSRGERFCGRRPPASWPPTSSLWRPCGARRSTSCSSSNADRRAEASGSGPPRLRGALQPTSRAPGAWTEVTGSSGRSQDHGRGASGTGAPP
jgi:hypothetical protein